MQLDRDLPDWLTAWSTFMSNSEAPAIYSKWVAVSMIAAALERKVYLQWDKRIYPNFYIVLVGPAGRSRKGTAMSPGREILDEIDICIAADATTREKLIRRLNEASDTFPAADGKIYSYAALTIFSEELTVFLSYQQHELMQNLADWYDCKNRWKYETKHQGVDDIIGVWVNLLGATTPELLQSALPAESFGGGLNSRIIYVYADQKEKLVIFPFERENQEELKASLIRDLQAIHVAAGEYKPDKSYLASWKAWYPKQHDHPLERKSSNMSGYVSRRPTHMHKLSIVMSASRSNDLVLTKHDFDRALVLLEETERRMFDTFAGVGKSRLSSVVQDVVEYIRLHKEATYSDIQRRFYCDASDDEMTTVLATLERAKLIKIDRDRMKDMRDYYVVYIGDL